MYCDAPVILCLPFCGDLSDDFLVNPRKIRINAVYRRPIGVTTIFAARIRHCPTSLIGSFQINEAGQWRILAADNVVQSYGAP
jgi:hypothetical protein